MITLRSSEVVDGGRGVRLTLEVAEPDREPYEEIVLVHPDEARDDDPRAALWEMARTVSVHLERIGLEAAIDQVMTRWRRRVTRDGAVDEVSDSLGIT